MFRFTVRELVMAITVVALTIGWVMDAQVRSMSYFQLTQAYTSTFFQLENARRQCGELERERDELEFKLRRSGSQLPNERGSSKSN